MFGENRLLFTGFHPRFSDDGPASGNLLVFLFLTVFGGALGFAVTTNVFCWCSQTASE